MANRYWVGGTAAWDATAGTKWALTSGGAGGQTVPGSTDDVFFDANSGAVTVTVSASDVCQSLNFTGFSGTFTGSSSINIYGSLTLASATTFSYTGSLIFSATSGSFTITSAGKTLACPVSIGASASTATWTLGDAFLSTSSITVSFGNFATGNFALSCTQIQSSVTNTRSISFGSSTVTLSAGNALVFTTNTNLTFNAGTSNIICASASVSFLTGASASAGLTFYNVSFTNSGAISHYIQGNSTFNNITVTGPSVAGVIILGFDGNQVINGTLSTAGTAGNRRVWFRSLNYGITRTLTCNSAASLTDADFRDLLVVGTAAPISGTRIGNLRGCTGITFSAAKTVYWVSSTSGSYSANNWGATSGGAASTDNFPLAQDTAIISNTGLTAGNTITLDGNIPFIGTLDMSTRTSAATISISSGNVVYGDWLNGSGITLSGVSALTFSGRNIQTVTSAGKTFSCPITIDTYGGTVQLADALNLAANALTVTNGTFDTKNFAVTAATLSSTNTNVRTINLGSSTVTLSANTVIDFTNGTNLTFNAGTSTLSCSGANTQINSSTTGKTGQTFYNLNLTNTAQTNPTIFGSNTFNNITITPVASTGIASLVFTANQTINGTLTAVGTSPTQRIFLRSDTLGTQRTITAAAVSLTDVDIRDIVAAGTATWSGTRVGNCQGNTGITFATPKTVYWNLAGTNNWSDTGWATSSGGAPGVNNFPLAQDTAVFDNTGSAGTITIDAAWNISTFEASSRTAAMTLTINQSPPAYGNWKFGSGVTNTGSGTISMLSRGSQIILNNGVSFSSNVNINAITGTYQMSDAFLMVATSTLTLTSGTFDAVTYNVTIGMFSDASTLLRTLKMGSANWTLTGTSFVWNIGNSTNFTLYKGTANIVLSDTSTSARTFIGTGLSYNKLTIGGTTGTSTTTIAGANQFTEIASTKTVAHTVAGTQAQTFGKWSVTGTAGNVVTVSGTATFTIAGARVSGVDYLAMGTTAIDPLSPGEFYAGANSTGTGTGVILTDAPTPVTRFWVGGTGTWDATTTTKWASISGGSGGASVPTSADSVIFDTASSGSAYTVTCTATQLRCGALTMRGPASGNITWAGTAPLAVHNDFKLLGGVNITNSYSGGITLSSSSTGRVLNTNGVSLASNVTINGVSCGWLMSAALSTTGTLIVTNGEIDTSGFAVTAFGLDSINSNIRNILLSTSTLNLSGNLRLGTTANESASLTFTAGTSQVNLSSNSPIFNGNGQTFYNFSYTDSSSGSSATINGSNIYNNLTFTSPVSLGIKNILLSANQTINGTLTVAGGTATNRVFLRSDTLGTVRTLTVAAKSLSDVDFRDIAATGAGAPLTGTRLGNCGGNSGITFTTKTVYWNLAGTNNWEATAWATSSGGTPAVANFPLAQDTAVFDNAGAITGVTIVTVFNYPNITMAARTSAMSFATNNPTTIYGNLIAGTGVTLSGTGAYTFSGKGIQTLTSAGKIWPSSFVVDCITGTLQLGDSFSSTGTLTLNSGTFDAVSYDLLITAFVSSSTKIRIINMGSGTWSLSNASSIWIVSASSLLTLNKNTSTIIFSNNTTAARDFNGGGYSYGKIIIGGNTAISTTSINNNNTFTEISSTKTVAHTISLGNSTQTVGAFTVAGTAGNLVTISGSSAASPATLIYTGATKVSSDYLVLNNVRAYSLSNTWYAGINSTNGGTLGWIFTAAVTAATGAFFLLF